LPVILSTNYTDVRVAVTSIKLGAFEFISKPIIPEELLKVIGMALKETNNSNKSLHVVQKNLDQPNVVIGNNTATKKLWEHIMVVAPTKLNVLIIGESGTGKEHIANAIHLQSKRKDKPFLAIDCG